MNIELICTGTELLTGKLNLNASFIAEQLAFLGLDLCLITSVADRKNDFSKVLISAQERSSVIIVTGGLGPTFDDITVETVSEILGIKTYRDENVMLAISELFEKKGLKTPPSNNERQAYILEGAKILNNRFGTAPGQMLHFEHIAQDNKKTRKTIFLLPGPPREMKPMFEENVLPFFKSYQAGMKKSFTFHVCGMPESLVDEKIRDTVNLFSENKDVEFAILAHQYIIDVKVSVKGEDELILDEIINRIKDEFAAILGDNIFGYDKDSLESAVQKLLIENKKTVSAAESCTGGMISSRLTNTPGSSLCFKQSVITYSNESKISLLSVKEETIKQFGAVSQNAAEEMLNGILNLSKTDYAVSVTGIAGPEGSYENKPVGLVFIGISYRGKNEISKHMISGSRKDIRERATVLALDLLRRAILKNSIKTKTSKGK